jgi:nucleotide-binding universal stress UspA family protein
MPSTRLVSQRIAVQFPCYNSAATDFSAGSLEAVLLGRRLAEQANAKFHLVHVIDSKDLPGSVLERLAPNGILRDEISVVAWNRMNEFIQSLGNSPTHVQTHVLWGIPSETISQTAKSLGVDLLVLGTVGRRGVNGILLGNTAERVIDTGNSSVLTVTPSSFVSSAEHQFSLTHSKSRAEPAV